MSVGIIMISFVACRHEFQHHHPIRHKEDKLENRLDQEVYGSICNATEDLVVVKSGPIVCEPEKKIYNLA